MSTPRHHRTVRHRTVHHRTVHHRTVRTALAAVAAGILAVPAAGSVSAATASEAVASGARAAAPAGSAAPVGSATVDATLTALVFDGRHRDTRPADGHTAAETRSRTTAYLTVGRNRVEIDPRLAGTARPGRVRIEVSGAAVTGRSADDIGVQLARGMAHVVRITPGAPAAGARAGGVLGTHHITAVPVYWDGAKPPSGPYTTNGLAFANTFWSGNTGKQITYTSNDQNLWMVLGPVT